MMLQVYTFDLMKQGSTNYELETVLVNKVLLVHYSAPFTSDCGCSPMMAEGGGLQQTFYGL